MPTKEQTLAESIADVSAKLQRIEKRGTAPANMGGFAFVRETDVMDALKPELDERGIILRPSVRVVDQHVYPRQGKDAPGVLLTVELELYAVRGSEELLLARTIGQGADTQDKASGKATTSAKKQAVLIAFAIPTGEDPEAHPELEQSRRQSSQRRQSESQPRRQSSESTSSRPTGTKGERIALLNSMLKQVDELQSQTVNRFSIRGHVRKVTKHDSVGELISKGTDEELRALIAYVAAKLKEPGADDDEPRRAEQMSDDEALAAGAALIDEPGYGS